MATSGVYVTEHETVRQLSGGQGALMLVKGEQGGKLLNNGKKL